MSGPDARPTPNAPMTDWTACTVREAVAGCARAHRADLELFRFPDDGSVWTVARLQAAADEAGARLLAAGARPGDAVAIWSPGRPLWPVVLLGAATVGVTVCGLNTRYNIDELTHVLGELRPRWVLVATGFRAIDSLALVRRAVDLAVGNGVATPVVVECPPGTDLPPLPITVDSATVDVEARAREVRPSDALLVQFTSGSTGHPKGVLVSQDAALRSAHHTWQGMGLEPGDRLYSALPYHHIGGSVCSGLLAVTGGVTVVTPETMVADAALDGIEALGCTAFHGHGALWNLLLTEQRERPRDLTTLRKGWASGDEVFLRRIHTELGVDQLTVLYGSSEAGVVASSVPADPLDLRLTTLGRPTPGVVTVVREPDGGAEVTDGAVGELWIGGPSTMIRYLHEPPGARRPRDLLPTGDLVSRDDQGFLHYHGRADDRLKPGGENVSVVEIERFIAEDSRVGRVVVVGIPDPRLGEVPAAVVEPAPGAVLEAEEVRSRCQDSIAGFKVPRRVLVLDSLPILDTGKVDRQRLRGLLLDDQVPR